MDAGKIRRLPRLETVLDVAVAAHGIGVLAELLADLISPPPNAQHQFFAEHLLVGGHHVTANFDTCIERAGGDESRLVHLHGVVGSWEAMGARLSVIEKGLPDTLQSQLRSIISASDLLVVVGYSGLDYFDVDPFWRDCNGEKLLEGKTVLWVEHNDSGWEVGEDPSRPHPQLRGFAAGGAEVHVIRAPTRDVLSALAVNWSIPPMDNVLPWEERDPVELGLDSEARERATTRLFAVMGLHDTVRERLAGRTLDREEHDWAASAAWTAGQYRISADHWAKAKPGADPETTAIRTERRAAALWLRGELRHARRELDGGLERAELEGVSPEERLVMAETLGRVLAHMARLPDTRLLVTSARRREALGYLDRAEAELSGPLGVEMTARVDSVRAALTGGAESRPGEEPVQDFNQSEALLAMLNYRHAELRKRAERGEVIDPSEYRRQADDFSCIGDWGDAARVPLLPGAEFAFSPGSVWKGFREVDFTEWHRIRLFAAWYGRRTVRRMRARVTGGRGRNPSGKEILKDG